MRAGAGRFNRVLNWEPKNIKGIIDRCRGPRIFSDSDLSGVRAGFGGVGVEEDIYSIYSVMGSRAEKFMRA